MKIILRTQPTAILRSPRTLLLLVLLSLLAAGIIMGQLNQSGGNATAVTVTSGTVTANAGTNLNTSLLALESGGNLATLAGAVSASKYNVNISSGSIGNTAFALNAGSAIIGFVRVLPPGCASLTTLFATATSQVATGAGTTVTSTTTCVTWAYANNITNSAVTLRLADKAGTPVIWLGGNNDFSIPANSNLKIPIEGVTFTSGITAIAGTASAVNLQINGLQ